ncbi:MAG: hypothetical protein ABEH43_00750, partial [Flavobacteriales bacterium]
SQRSWYPHNQDHNLKGAIKKAIFSNVVISKLFSSGKASSEHRSGPSKHDQAKKIEVGGLYGAFILMKKEVFLQSGGFDPDFFMYSEDIEMFRNRLRKFRAVVLSDVFI